MECGNVRSSGVSEAPRGPEKCLGLLRKTAASSEKEGLWWLLTLAGLLVQLSELGLAPELSCLLNKKSTNLGDCHFGVGIGVKDDISAWSPAPENEDLVFFG